MYTGKSIFDKAIAIIDELSDSGAVSDSQVKEYKNRAPHLLDLWQKEMAALGKLYNVQEYENTENINKWVKFTLPAMNKISDIIFLDTDSQLKAIKYKRFGKSDIYFYFTEPGTVRVLYIPIPAEITSLDQTLEIDDSTYQSGAYYLAEQFALSDMNDELARKCRDKFKELKYEAVDNEPITPVEIEDVYV